MLTVNHKEAVFYSANANEDSHVLGTLKDPEIIFINSYGIRIRGIEMHNFDKLGREIFTYQEWYCSYIIKDK